ncbi:MAG: hypothetical protein IBX43_07520 [Campylobacterales bacterium]|nr:hypothetical protein [Campylobacterales bacterium]
MTKFFIPLLMFTLSLFAKDALKCEVVNEDEIYKIKCTYLTTKKSHDRNISIAWTSPSTPQDDRFKTILLPAENISVYDYRYFDGRADGSWVISATDASTGEVTTTEFVKADLSESNISSLLCKDPSLGQPLPVK